MDNELKQFFEEWKKEDDQLSTPDFPIVKSKSRSRIWQLAAACAVVLVASTFLIRQQYSNYILTQRQDSTTIKETVVETQPSDMYEWQSPTSSLASDF